MIPQLLRSVFFLFLLSGVLGSTCLAQEKFAGTGIQAVPVSTGELVVLDVVADSPADLAGLHPGDFIVQADDFVLRGSDFEHVVRNYLWGKAGEVLTVTYLRPGREGEFTADLEREPLTGEVEKIPGIRLMQPETEN